MTTKADLTIEQRIALLRHLAEGKSLEAVALILHCDRSDVLDVASKHGYPDHEKMAWAADVLEEKADAEARPAPHPDPAAVIRTAGRTQTPAGGASTPPSAGPAPRPQRLPASAAGGATPHVDRIRVLIDEGKAHSTKKIQAAAERAETAVRRLRELVDADRAREAERKRRAEERAKAEAEVRALEAQLAEARAKLRPASPATAGDGPSAAEVRAWARANNVDCPATGRVPRAVREAYDNAQEES